MRFNETREIAAITLAESRSFNVGMHSGIYELIWFKLGVMIVTIGFYILIIVFVTLAFIPAEMNAKKHKGFSRFGLNVLYC